MNTAKIKKMEEAALGDLSARDRVKMILEAGARGDRETIRRLLETCPRATYQMRKANFTEALDGTRRLANAGAGIWGQARGALQMVEAFQAEEKEAAGGPGRTARGALLREQQRYILEGFRSAWTGFDTYCRQAYGVPGIILLTGLPLEDDYTLPAEELTRLEEMIGGAAGEGEPIKELADYWLEIFQTEFSGGGRDQ